MVAGLHVCDALANGFDDTSSFVSKDDGKSSLRIFPRECV